MSEMIERVAKTISEAQARPHGDGDVARAAIEAMREPTPQMQMVNQGVFMNAAKGYTIEGSDWHRIIDAALSPSGEK